MRTPPGLTGAVRPRTVGHMAGRRGSITVLSAVIVLLLSGSVAGLARTQAATVDVSTGAGPTLPEVAGDTDVEVDVAGIMVEAPPPTAAAPAPSTPTTGAPAGASSRTTVTAQPKSGAHRDQARGPGEVGSVADLGPGPVEPTVPAPCTPSSQTTAPHAVAVVERRAGCVRRLVPAGTPAGPEVSWSPDGSWLLTTVQGRVVRLARDGTWRQDLGGGGQARFAVMSPDGRHIAVGGSVPHGNLSQKPVLVVAAADGTDATVIEMRVMRPPSWSPDSQVLAAISSGGEGGPRPDVVTVVGADGRVRATRSFPNRSLFGINNGPLVPGPALLGQPLLLPDGRLFQPAFIEIPRRATGLWLTRALTDTAGPEPPDDLRWSERVSAPADASSIVYTAMFSADSSSPIRRLDLRTGQTVTLAADGVTPSSSHRTNAVAFFSRNAQGTGQGLSVVGAAGANRLAWHHSGTSCTCVDGGQPAWTADDAAIAVAI